MAKDDERGNAVASAAAYQKSLVRQAETLWRFEKVWDDYEQEGVVLTQFRVIMPGIVGGEYRIVLKCEKEGAKFVAFHSASTLIETLVGLVNRLENRSLKFKEDQYA